PGVPFSTIGGVVVDRMDKRLVLWVSNILRMITMLLVVVSLLYDRNNLWPLYVLTFMTALIGQFFTPAEAASIPLLIGERELVPALSLFNITMTLAQAIGLLVLGRIVATIFPPFTLSTGALVLHVHSIDMLFVVVAFFYFVCAVLILSIPAKAFQEEQADKSAMDTINRPLRFARAWQILQSDVVEGWRFVRSDRLLFFSVFQLSA